MQRSFLSLAIAIGIGATAPLFGAAPTFQDLMSPDIFTKPQCGMVVRSVSRTGGTLRVITTGAEVTLREGRNEIAFRQRIGHRRQVALLHLPEPIQGMDVEQHNAARVMIRVRRPALRIRINGDSLFMIQPVAAATLTVESRILPAWHASYAANHLLADEFGAFGIYCSESHIDDHFDPYAAVVAKYSLPPKAVLWLAVCPPKPYDWNRSFKDIVVWHWSRTLGYPSDESLRSWRPYGNIVLLQSEVMLWKNWNLAFEPRLGRAEFARVRNTIHNLGMRFIVYTSPYYFLKGTPVEHYAFNSFRNFKGWPPGWGTGENMELFLREIRHVMHDLKPDGLYFDGQYKRNPAALYALARRSRAIVGEKGILEWHSTQALGSRLCYLPQADAYVDFILRGEGRQALYGNFDYLRFFVSGYNISNSIGVLCDNGRTGLTPEWIDDLLRANGRLHLLVGWLKRKEIMALWQHRYKPRLTPALREFVEKGLEKRQMEIGRKIAALRAERAALRRAPGATAAQPVFQLKFTRTPPGQPVVSPQNRNPFRIENGNLVVRGHANTYAYYRIPLHLKATGFQVKIRHASDGGMSWGPAAMLRWGNGRFLRLGTRSDATLQVDTAGAQLCDKPYDPQKWIWLRARWKKHLVIVESSLDGVRYEPLWIFEHGGAFTGPTTELLVGKVPFNGEAADYKIPGAVGRCEIGGVTVFGTQP